jgi:glycosyltransferase involved in cell wall biosynthesis
VFAGRLIPDKHVDLLVRAIGRLAADGAPVSCRIVGDGPARGELTDLVRTLGIGHLVSFTGALPCGDDVLGAMKAARVLVLPSTREGFGMVVLEANACGIPVVTVGHPGNAAAELVRDGLNGWVVAPEPAAIADAIGRAVRAAPDGNDADRIARHVRRYAWSRLVREHGLADLYRHPSPAPRVTDPAPAGTR